MFRPVIFFINTLPVSNGTLSLMCIKSPSCTDYSISFAVEFEVVLRISARENGLFYPSENRKSKVMQIHRQIMTQACGRNGALFHRVFRRLVVSHYVMLSEVSARIFWLCFCYLWLKLLSLWNPWSSERIRLVYSWAETWGDEKKTAIR